MTSWDAVLINRRCQERWIPCCIAIAARSETELYRSVNETQFESHRNGYGDHFSGPFRSVNICNCLQTSVSSGFATADSGGSGFCESSLLNPCIHDLQDLSQQHRHPIEDCVDPDRGDERAGYRQFSVKRHQRPTRIAPNPGRARGSRWM